MEVEFIRASMDVRAEKERLRQRPHARFEKVDGERNSPLRLQWGEEREPWVWQVEVRPSVRCVEFEGTTGIRLGHPVGSLDLRREAWWSLRPLASR